MSRLLDNLRAQWDETVVRMTAITDQAAGENRDMNDVERANFSAFQAQLDEMQPRVQQLVGVERSVDSTAELFASISETGRNTLVRTEAPALVSTYRTAGAYLCDVLRAYGPNADHDARKRVQQAAIVNRTVINGATVADITTDDLLGIVPEPIIGPIWNTIDGSRPVVSTLVQRPLVSPLMFRPKVTQHTQVGPQGTAGKLGSLKTTGASVDEKKAFVSREMKLARIDIEPIALGGVVDLSLWAEMFSPNLLDIIVADLAAEYAIQTEAVAAAEVLRAATASALTTVVLGPDTITQAIFDAAAKVYGLTGKMPTHLGMSVDVWAKIGGMVDDSKRPLYPAIGGTNANATGGNATSLSGTVNSLTQVVSPGFPAGTLIVYAAGGIEVFERRLGVLQAIEPERAGRVVSYSGLFTTKAMDDGAAVKVVYT